MARMPRFLVFAVPAAVVGKVRGGTLYRVDSVTPPNAVLRFARLIRWVL